MSQKNLKLKNLGTTYAFNALVERLDSTQKNWVIYHGFVKKDNLQSCDLKK